MNLLVFILYFFLVYIPSHVFNSAFYYLRCQLWAVTLKHVSCQTKNSLFWNLKLVSRCNIHHNLIDWSCFLVKYLWSSEEIQSFFLHLLFHTLHPSQKWMFWLRTYWIDMYYLNVEENPSFVIIVLWNLISHFLVKRSNVDYIFHMSYSIFFLFFFFILELLLKKRH